MSPDARRAIAVFGSSEPVPGDALYETARRLGALLADSGWDVVTGGYGGVMEAASRGAGERGGPVCGVLCSIFADRRPNPWVSVPVDTPDLHERTRRLVELSHGYVVLHGKSGTLAELTLLWALHRAGQLGPRPIVLLGEAWAPLLQHLERWGMLEPAQRAVTLLADTPERAVELLRPGTV